MKFNCIQALILIFTLSNFAHAAGAKSKKPPKIKEMSLNISDKNLAGFSFKSPRNFSFLKHDNLKTHDIGKRTKTYKNESDKVFVDGWNREVYFRGWNINGNSKNSKYNFRPYKDSDMAFNSLEMLEEKTGSNIVRWLFTWEGAQPAVDKIDLKYFDNQVEQLRLAIKKGMYVFIDFHQDTFSQHIDGGSNGAPKWIVDGLSNLDGKRCGKLLAKLCDIAWSVHYILNKDVTRGLRAFWDNSPIKTPIGERKVQDEFLKTVSAGLKRIKEKLTPEEFQYVLGLDPFNEPHYGGTTRRHKTRKWLNDKLFPFYHKVRSIMDQTGWSNKWLYAEPHMMWNLKLPISTQIGSGTGLLKNPPKKGKWIFNFHFYDETRESIGLTPVKNGAYLKIMDKAIQEARNWGMPNIASEFGTWPIGGGKLRKEATDTNRNLKAAYQAFEMRKIHKEITSRYADFYSPFINTTQWTWETHVGGSTSGDLLSTDRSYPKRVQGELMSFYYNTNVKTFHSKSEMNWVALRPSNKQYFEKNKYTLAIWRGRKSEAPTEIYIPNHFNLKNTLVLTDKKILNGIDQLNMISTKTNDELLLNKTEKKGSTLFIYDDLEGHEKSSTFHFALIAELNDLSDLKNEELRELHGDLIRAINKEENPLYFLGKFKMDTPLIR